MKPTAVYLERGSKRVFACALDWPGWCRSGKDEEAALASLSLYASRYAVAAARVGAPFPARAGDHLEVVERLRGTATTDFGAPGEVATLDREPLRRPQAERVAALVAACWEVFDDVIATAPATLRKGPRGGGRDRDAIVQHVLDAESAYARKLGIRQPAPAPGDTAAVSLLRSGIVGVLRAASSRLPALDKGWPPRYAARRIAWHVLDHAWEVEDRSTP